MAGSNRQSHNGNGWCRTHADRIGGSDVRRHDRRARSGCRRPSDTFQAARSLDLLTVRTPLLAASMWIRALPERLLGKAVSPPPQLVVAEQIELPGWLLLGEQPNREIAFGAVGKFWRPVIEWRDVAPADFVAFANRVGERSPQTFRWRLTVERRCSVTNAEPPRRMRGRIGASCATGGSSGSSSRTSCADVTRDKSGR